jgi:RNA polymerase sigma factor (sigma-70 family)
VSSSDLHRSIDAIWRIESTKLIARLVRIVRDIGVAEELASSAFVTALERWPTDGVPENPGAWLMQTAKHRAIDFTRHRAMLEKKHDALAHEPLNDVTTRDLDDDVGDDVLRLIFAACHPVLSPDARVSLTLRLIAGLSVDEIARGFLTSPTTIQQRIVRAKRTLENARVPFSVPHGDELRVRLSSVLEVIYLVFNEGYAAMAGDDWMRPELCTEALRLGRIVLARVPDDAEVHGLNALMEIQASRTRARTSASGDPILLLDQNRALWDRLLIRRGLAALARALALSAHRGPYTLQAAIAACHARATTAEATDWQEIATLYDALQHVTGSPIVDLNRAVAHGMAFGAARGLALVDALANEPSLARYHFLPSVRGDLLEKLARHDEARAEFERAASMTLNMRERALLEARARACAEFVS